MFIYGYTCKYIFICLYMVYLVNRSTWKEKKKNPKENL